MTVREATGRAGLKFRLFPLTPALSLGEREQQAARAEILSDLRIADRLAMILPLPKGEGWGEGKEHAHSTEQVRFRLGFRTLPGGPSELGPFINLSRQPCGKPLALAFLSA